jgi:hypothetical protein
MLSQQITLSLYICGGEIFTFQLAEALLHRGDNMSLLSGERDWACRFVQMPIPEAGNRAHAYINHINYHFFKIKESE